MTTQTKAATLDRPRKSPGRKPMPDTKRVPIACRLKQENLRYLREIEECTGKNFGRILDGMLDAARSAGIGQ